jgi:hypothetical protein
VGIKSPIRSVTSMTPSGIQLTFPDGVIVSSGLAERGYAIFSPLPITASVQSTSVFFCGSCLNAQVLQLGVNLSDTGSETQISKDLHFKVNIIPVDIPHHHRIVMTDQISIKTLFYFLSFVALPISAFPLERRNPGIWVQPPSNSLPYLVHRP